MTSESDYVRVSHLVPEHVRDAAQENTRHGELSEQVRAIYRRAAFGDREDAEWVKESVIRDAQESDCIVVSGAWLAAPAEGKDRIDVYRFEHSVDTEPQDGDSR